MINSTRCAFMAKQACATFSKVVRKITPPHANNLLKFFFALFATLTLGAATAWAETKTEGFEEATTSTNYQGTVTVNTEQSDCGIGWTIYYGCVSTSSKISGNNSAALRLYTSNNYGYLKTTTPIDGLSNVTFKAKAATSNSAKIKVNISYSKDGSTWTNIKSDETYGTTSQSKSYDIPSGGKYFQIAISSNSTKPSKKNAQLTIDDIVFTYTSSATPDPVEPTVTFSNGSYTVGGSALDLSTLWTSNSDGAVTYSIVEAGTTGATINGTSFTATAAGICTVKASQAATSAYNAIEKTATITVTAPTPATITISEAGQEKTVEGKYVGDSYELPLTSTQTCGTKTFVGWSTVKISTPSDKPTTSFYEPGTEITLAESQTFYAVFADSDGLSDEDEVLFSYEGGTSNDLTNTEGLSASGLGSDYADDHTYYRAKLDGTGDYILYYNESKPYISQIIFKVKMIGGENTSKMTVKTSDDGKNYTEKSECTISGKQNNVITLTATVNTYAKYLQLYFTKGSNVGFGPLHIYTKSTSYQNYTTKCAQTYTVTFDANGQGTAPEAQTVEENTKATEPTAPSATGYTFGGWYTDPACSDDKKFDFNTPITKDITLYAKWTAETYTITLDANGGKFIKDGVDSETVEIKYTHGTYTSYDAAQLISEYLEEKGITLSREGYQLNEMWQSNGSSWKRVFTDIDRTIIAQWSKLYTITLSENGKETTPTTQTGTSYTLPSVLSADSCQDDTKEFVGWTTNEELSSETTPTSDFYEKGETVTLSEDKTTFYAVFATPKIISGEMVEEEVTAAVNISDYASAKGWENGTKYETVNIDDNITATASGDENTGKYYTSGTNWRLYYSENATLTIEAKNGITINSLKITYVSEKNGVLLNNGEQISSGEECIVNAESVQFKTGLSSGTESGQVRITKMEVTYTTTVQADDIVTYSNYSTKCVPTCKITYNFDGGDGECTTDIVEKYTEYTLCSTPPTKEGHTFLNWKDQHGTNKYEAGDKITSVTEDLTLTAQWQVNSYEVTWMSLGSKLSSSKVNYNIQPTKPSTNPTYLCGTDKEFVGWTTQEIDGVGTPANLYTDDFPVVTKATTYHAVFAKETSTIVNANATMEYSGTTTTNMNDGNNASIVGLDQTIFTITSTKNGSGTYVGLNKDGDIRLYATKDNGNGNILTMAMTEGYTITSITLDIKQPADFVVKADGNVVTGTDNVYEINHSSCSIQNTTKGATTQLHLNSVLISYATSATTYDYVTSCEEVGSDMSNSTKVTPSVESGIFSVGDGKYVQFSTGNLQYEVGTNTWSFASEQYEVIGGAAYDPANPTNTNYGMNEPGYTGKLDLFGWSSDGKFGVNPSNTDADYGDAAADFVDWGNLVDDTGWYTLTQNEMNYILSRKKDDKKLWALATVHGMKGLILLPDNWNTSTTLEYGYIPADWNYEKNKLDAAAWAVLEAAGAVFLPEGGSRVGGHGNKDLGGGPAEFDAHGDYFHVDNVGEMGYYWLNTQDTRTGYENCASFLILPSWSDGETNANEDDICLPPQVWSREKRRGNSVRLVKEVPAYTVSVTAENGTVTGAGTYPQGAEVTLTATAADGYKFTNWSNGETTNPYTFTIAADVNLTANFEAVTVTPEIYTRTVTEGNYGTICLPYGGTITGAVLYECVGSEPGKVYLGSVTTLVAGVPYIFQATATELAVYSDGTTAVTAGNSNGLYGTFDNETVVATGNYILKDNELRPSNGNAKVNANRAYLVMGEVPADAPQQMPGRRYIGMSVQGENEATGFENITNGENTTIKFIENGQLFIIRNGEKFNAQGQKL